MEETTALLRHFLASIAYRTQKALRDAPDGFGDFVAGEGVRSPRDLVRHMASVLGYARTFMVGGVYQAEPLASLEAEVERFHQVLGDLGAHLSAGTPLDGITHYQLLQGPLSDVMTHAGQLALLRRLAGSPVAPENFVMARISADQLGADQPQPAAPDPIWMGKLVQLAWAFTRAINRVRSR